MAINLEKGSLLLTLTAAWWVKVCRGENSSSVYVLSQMLRVLSLPPLASSLPSGDQARPHTSNVWPCAVPM